MKRWLVYTLVGIVSYTFFLLYLIPAGYAYSLVEKPIQQQLPAVALSGVEGRVWNGTVNSLAYNGRALGSLSWKLGLFSLLTGDLVAPVSIQLPDGYVELEATLPFNMENVRAEDLKGQIPAAQIQQLFPYYPVSIGGTFAINMTEIAADNSGSITAAEGRLNWVGAMVLAPQQLALGDLQAELHLDEEGRLIADLKDMGGPLKLNAKLTLEKDKRYRLSGTVAAGKEADAGLRQALAWLGKPDAQGRFRIDRNGRL